MFLKPRAKNASKTEKSGFHIIRKVYAEVYVRYMIGTCFQTCTSSENSMYKGFRENEGICLEEKHVFSKIIAPKLAENLKKVYICSVKNLKKV